MGLLDILKRFGKKAEDHVKINPFVRRDVDPFLAWEKEDKIGDGAFGEVFRGRQKETGRLAAIKQIGVDSEEDLMDYMVEINILTKCKHKTIIELFEAYLYDSKLWLCLEYCKFGALDSIMIELDKGLAEPQIRMVCREVTDGLKYLHSQGVIHRDLKAGNVLLTSEAVIKLADFGVSAMGDSPEVKRNSFIGSQYWMAPEVMACETYNEVPYGTQADVWSLGVTLIELAQMLPPHHNMQPMRVAIRVIKGDPPRLERPKQWSDEFNHFLSRCLVKTPETRANISELLAHKFISGVQESDRRVLRNLIAELQASPEVEVEEVDLRESELRGGGSGLGGGVGGGGVRDSIFPIADLDVDEDAAGSSLLHGERSLGGSSGRLSAVGEAETFSSSSVGGGADATVTAAVIQDDAKSEDLSASSPSVEIPPTPPQEPDAAPIVEPAAQEAPEETPKADEAPTPASSSSPQSPSSLVQLPPQTPNAVVPPPDAFAVSIRRSRSSAGAEVSAPVPGATADLLNRDAVRERPRRDGVEMPHLRASASILMFEQMLGGASPPAQQPQQQQQQQPQQQQPQQQQQQQVPAGHQPVLLRQPKPAAGGVHQRHRSDDRSEVGRVRSAFLDWDRSLQHSQASKPAQPLPAKVAMEINITVAIASTPTPNSVAMETTDSAVVDEIPKNRSPRSSVMQEELNEVSNIDELISSSFNLAIGDHDKDAEEPQPQTPPPPPQQPPPVVTDIDAVPPSTSSASAVVPESSTADQPPTCSSPAAINVELVADTSVSNNVGLNDSTSSNRSNVKSGYGSVTVRSSGGAAAAAAAAAGAGASLSVASEVSSIDDGAKSASGGDAAEETGNGIKVVRRQKDAKFNSVIIKKKRVFVDESGQQVVTTTIRTVRKGDERKIQDQFIDRNLMGSNLSSPVSNRQSTATKAASNFWHEMTSFDANYHGNGYCIVSSPSGILALPQQPASNLANDLGKSTPQSEEDNSAVQVDSSSLREFNTSYAYYSTAMQLQLRARRHNASVVRAAGSAAEPPKLPPRRPPTLSLAQHQLHHQQHHQQHNYVYSVGYAAPNQLAKPTADDSLPWKLKQQKQFPPPHPPPPPPPPPPVQQRLSLMPHHQHHQSAPVTPFDCQTAYRGAGNLRQRQRRQQLSYASPMPNLEIAAAADFACDWRQQQQQLQIDFSCWLQLPALDWSLDSCLDSIDSPKLGKMLYRDRREQLREQKLLNKAHQKQDTELSLRHELEKQNLEQRFRQELQLLARDFDAAKARLRREADEAERQMNQQFEKSLRQETQRAKEQQERGLRDLRDSLRQDKKRLTREELKNSQRELKEKDKEAERSLLQRLAAQFEEHEAAARVAHRKKLDDRQRALVRDLHALERKYRQEREECEERHLYERFEMRLYQHSQHWLLKKQQAMERHERDLDRLRKQADAKRDVLNQSQALERRRRPKLLKKEQATRMRMFRESLLVTNPGLPDDETRRRLREFDESEKERCQTELSRLEGKLARAKDEFERRVARVDTEVRHEQQEMRKLIAEREADQRRDLEAAKRAQLKEFQELRRREKEALEQRMADEMRDLEARLKSESRGESSGLRINGEGRSGGAAAVTQA
uniref:Protein kinase domain-containing protein n=1 Tax=Macrostomum lignano TaxID=282301 RepID=A0A1I8HL07_9PLAT